MVKNSPAMQEMRVPFLDREDPLEKDLATHSSILAWWTTVRGIAESDSNNNVDTYV